MISRATRPAVLAGQASKETLSGAGSDRVGTRVALSLGLSILAGAEGGFGAAGAVAMTLGDASIFLPGAPTSMKGRSSDSSISSAAGGTGFGSEAVGGAAGAVDAGAGASGTSPPALLWPLSCFSESNILPMGRLQ